MICTWLGVRSKCLVQQQRKPIAEIYFSSVIDTSFESTLIRKLKMINCRITNK